MEVKMQQSKEEAERKDMAGWEAGRREAQSEHKREFEEKAAENKRLQDQIQFLENELKRLEQQHAETLKDKDVEISRLKKSLKQQSHTEQKLQSPSPSTPIPPSTAQVSQLAAEAKGSCDSEGGGATPSAPFSLLPKSTITLGGVDDGNVLASSPFSRLAFSRLDRQSLDVARASKLLPQRSTPKQQPVAGATPTQRRQNTFGFT